MKRLIFLLIGMMLGGCASLEAPRSDLAPTGKLRAAINLGNPVLAGRGTGGDLAPPGDAK